MKFHLITLGCSKNTSDSESLANAFTRRGWEWSEKAGEANLVLVNTCGFIKDAKEESLNVVIKTLELKKSGNTKVCVFGCLVKRYRAAIEKEIPEIDFLYEFLSDKDIEHLTNLMTGGKPLDSLDHNKSWRFFTPNHIGILKIAEGCSNLCTYCAIPGIRGPFQSRPEKQILDDAVKLAKSGAVELCIVAQDITRYGTENNGICQLPPLVRKLSKIEEIRWIRLHYMHPRGLTKNIIDDLYSIPKVVPYFDIPFQHVSDRMLRLMNRHTPPDHLKALIKHIRRNFKNSAIRTTFIVGFPGENEEEFQELLDFIENFPLDRVGAFAYSTEEGTPASHIIPKVPSQTKQNRLDRLMTLQQLLIEERNRRLINKKVELIIDKVEADHIEARTKWDAYEVDNLTRVIDYKYDLQPGQIVEGKIISADAYDFTAEIL
ncbi:MAG: 30S ribosomal protein S12 methylthiotransferase RimO [Candidatus Rifleibacteriota bacterium]